MTAADSDAQAPKMDGEIPTWWMQLVGDLKIADHLGDARGSVGWAPEHLKAYAYAVFSGEEPNYWSRDDV